MSRIRCFCRPRSSNVGHAIAFACALLACATAVGAQQKSADPTPVKATATDFRNLKFLEGRWRGTGYSSPFFETYRFVNDSTVEMGTSQDSTFRTVQPGSKIVLRGGAIYMEEGQNRSAVTAIDSAGYRFTAPGARYWFVFKRQNANEWTATLANGTVYRMLRIN